MEGSSSSLGTQYHIRSISLPSRLHPSDTKIESDANKLRTAFSSATSPITSHDIQNGLVGVAELYNSLEELAHSPHTQEALVQHRNGALVEDALEGPIGLLDLCGSLKDMLLLMKENVQDLQSVLRRKGGDYSIDGHIVAYFCARKKVVKITAKCLRELKQMEYKASSSLPVDADQHLVMVIRVLRHEATITISVFRYLLLFLSVPLKTKSSNSRWSLMSKFMSKSSTACDSELVIINEVENVDFALHPGKIVCVEMIQERLQSLEARIQGFEDGLDYVSRRLIRSRASLLNILAN